MMPFSKNLKCEYCSNEFLVVGSDDPTVSMSTSADGAVAENVIVGSFMSTEGPKQDIRFDAICPECKNKNSSHVSR
ncbi:hypothetical protein MHB65_06995 [Lysinibacillus sp. FSL K6-0075]|uniref:hypothetical protein n=1 Tax=Lysinibacillus sp. FSL K6-0075 TaxID=2921415 RepID=UPI0031596336